MKACTLQGVEMHGNGPIFAWPNAASGYICDGCFWGAVEQARQYGWLQRPRHMCSRMSDPAVEKLAREGSLLS